MHPILLESRLRLRLAGRRWWQQQPDSGVLAIAGLAAVLVLGWVLWQLLPTLIDAPRRLWNWQPWIPAAVCIAAAAGGGWRLGRSAAARLRGRWSVQPRAARLLPRLQAQIALLLAIGVGLLALGLGSSLGTSTAAALGLGTGCAASSGIGARIALAGQQRRHTGASPTRSAAQPWPAADLPTLLQRWLVDRIGASMRYGRLSLGGFLAIGLLVPGEVNGLPLLLGLLVAALLLRWLVVIQAAARLLIEASRRLRAQPLPARQWRSAHARCVLPSSAALGLLAALGLALLGTPWWLLPVLLLALVGLAWLDLWILACHRWQPRRRMLAWRLLLVGGALLARDLWPALPLLWLWALLHHRRLGLQAESGHAA